MSAECHGGAEDGRVGPGRLWERLGMDSHLHRASRLENGIAEDMGRSSPRLSFFATLPCCAALQCAVVPTYAAPKRHGCSSAPVGTGLGGGALTDGICAFTKGLEGVSPLFNPLPCGDGVSGAILGADSSPSKRL